MLRETSACPGCGRISATRASNGLSLPLDANTFVHVLRDNGYRTALYGKAHLQIGQRAHGVQLLRALRQGAQLLGVAQDFLLELHFGWNGTRLCHQLEAECLDGIAGRRRGQGFAFAGQVVECTLLHGVFNELVGDPVKVHR